MADGGGGNRSGRQHRLTPGRSGASPSYTEENETMAVAADRVAKMRAKRLWAAHLRRSYCINWPSGTPRDVFIAYTRWHATVRRTADIGDAAPLIDLLRSDAPLHRDARDLLANLFTCRQVTRKPGRQADPTRVSFAQGNLHLQAGAYRYHRRQGVAHDEALRQALLEFKAEEAAACGGEPPGDDELNEMVTDADIERLDGHIRGKRGTTRRVQKRRKG